MIQARSIAAMKPAAPSAWIAALAPAAILLACLLFPCLARGYVDPPVKLGAEPGHLADTAGLLVESSPRKISVGGVECTRVVIVDFDTGEGDPSSRGIVTSFNRVGP